MNDIDFDELDRAVSSVTDSTPTPEPATPNSLPSPAARRSSGRFMDVVHPSSDMRTASPQPRPVEVPDRPAPEAVSGGSFQWPDPIDVASTNPPVDNNQDGVPPAPEVSSPTDDSPHSPLESPFLSDAKVEKRPLGAATPVKSLEGSLAELTAETNPPAPVEAESLPTASAGAVDVADLEVSEEALIGAEQSSDTTPGVPQVADDVEEPVPGYKGAEVSPDPPVVTSPASITQQYTEQPSTTEQPSGAIFDTESYHQPLAHPQKKQSSLAIVLWIVGLVILGAGLGAAMYFFVLPML